MYYKYLTECLLNIEKYKLDIQVFVTFVKVKSSEKNRRDLRKIKKNISKMYKEQFKLKSIK